MNGVTNKTWYDSSILTTFTREASTIEEDKTFFFTNYIINCFRINFVTVYAESRNSHKSKCSDWRNREFHLAILIFVLLQKFVLVDQEYNIVCFSLLLSQKEKEVYCRLAFVILCYHFCLWTTYHADITFNKREESSRVSESSRPLRVTVFVLFVVFALFASSLVQCTVAVSSYQDSFTQPLRVTVFALFVVRVRYIRGIRVLVGTMRNRIVVLYHDSFTQKWYF